MTTRNPRTRRRLVGGSLLGATLALSVGAAALPAGAGASPAQLVAEGGPPHRVRFARGTDHATVAGSLVDGVSDRYVLWAGAGQQLVVSGLGALHVSVTAPDGSTLPGGPGDTIAFALPSTGDYVVEVMPGMGEAASYHVTFTIPAVRHDPAPSRVQFPRGTFGTTVNGRMIGGQLNRYLLRAAAGQTMTVSLDAARSAARFSILAPDGSVLAGEQTAARVVLPADGDYTVAIWSIAGNPSYDVSFDIR